MYGIMDILAQRQAALLAELPAELILGPVASTIQAELAVQRKQAIDAMLEALDSERYRKLIGLMHHWRSDPPFTAAADASADAIDSAIKKAKKKAGKRLDSRGCGAARLASHPMSCSIVPARHRNAIGMRWKLPSRSGAARLTRSSRIGRTCKTCSGIIRMPL